MTNRNWIEFTDPPAGLQRPDKIYASLNHRGSIVLNRKGFEELEHPEAVVLLFDPDTDTIGLRPTSSDTINAFKVNRKGAYPNREINASRFVRKHDIRVDGTVRFPTARIEHGVLILELKFRIPVIVNRRRG